MPPPNFPASKEGLIHLDPAARTEDQIEDDRKESQLGSGKPLALQAGGRRFDPGWLHSKSNREARVCYRLRFTVSLRVTVTVSPPVGVKVVRSVSLRACLRMAFRPFLPRLHLSL